MNRLLRNCIYQGKNLFRDYGFSFWSLLYPLILSFFFYMAFSGIIDIELGSIPVALEEGNRINDILEEIEAFNTYKLTRSQAMEMVMRDEVYGFIDKDLNLIIKDSGINQTIIKELLEQFKQMERLNKPPENFDFQRDYIRANNQKSSPIIIIFYSLIAMVSTYGVFAGIMMVNFIQANLSNVGARLNITPLRRSSFLIAGTIVALTLNLTANGILLLFIRYVLKIQLFNEFKYSSIFIGLGNLFGVALGMLIGACNKRNHSVKILMAIGFTLTLSFFSGMMGEHIKLMLDRKVPLLGRLNPISIITNNLYRINLLESTKGLKEGIIILSLYPILLTFISYMFLRRRNYDSL